jgi:3-deoxy-D-manno-octulosonic acid hydroxylase-like protein
MNATCHPSIAERLERGEIVHLREAPFPLPQGADLELLLRLRLAPFAKEIRYDPATERSQGVWWAGPTHAEAAKGVFAQFSWNATAWLARALRRYSAHWEPEHVSFRPQRIVGNELLRLDADATAASAGHRILRVFANIHPLESCTWATSDPFARLLERYGDAMGLASAGSISWLGEWMGSLLAVLSSELSGSSGSTSLLKRFHQHMRSNAEFQVRTPRQIWEFEPGSVWLAMTDACSHAVLHSQFTLEHAFVVPPTALALLDESPAALIRRHIAVRNPRSPWPLPTPRAVARHSTSGSACSLGVDLLG